MAKPKIAVFKFSSCAGCQLSILNLEEHLLDIVGAVDLSYFVMAKRENLAGPYDIGLVEGAVTTTREVEELKQIRKECQLLVALGTCACFGGVPSIKNFIGTQKEIEARVYTHLWDINSIPAYGIDYYVPVDAYLRGCAVDLGELLELLRCALLGVSPRYITHAVCGECKLKENGCLLLGKGQPCMGSVTAGGCGALCPSLNRACEGCRGPSDDCNAASLARVFHEQLGLTKDDVVRKFRKYAGNTPQFRKGAEAL
ncbi:MAG: oxidoreductase [Bacillota bacterium]|jgi:sulfhydrogenase subunit delta